jgi:hypothetical protein
MPRCSACDNCRAVKARCVNDYSGGSCERCISRKVDCWYPSIPRIRVTSDTREQAHEAAKLFNQRRIADLLYDPRMDRVWEGLFKRFSHHYGLELFCVNIPHLKARISESEKDKHGDIMLVLLGIVVLSAQYAPWSAARICELLRITDLSLLVELLGIILKERIEQPSIEKLQGLLMLSFYEWTEGNDSKGRFYSGSATFMVRELELGMGKQPGAPDKTELCRAAFNCYIIDRMMGSRNKPPIIRSEYLRIQVLRKEQDFNSEQGQNNCLAIIYEGVGVPRKSGPRTWFVQLVDIWDAIRLCLAGPSRDRGGSGHSTPSQLSPELIREYHVALEYATSNYLNHQQDIDVWPSFLYILALDCALLKFATEFESSSDYQAAVIIAQNIITVAKKFQDNLPTSWFIMHAVSIATLVVTYSLSCPGWDKMGHISNGDRINGCLTLERIAKFIPLASAYHMSIRSWEPSTINGSREWLRLVDCLLDLNSISQLGYSNGESTKIKDNVDITTRNPESQFTCDVLSSSLAFKQENQGDGSHTLAKGATQQMSTGQMLADQKAIHQMPPYKTPPDQKPMRQSMYQPPDQISMDQMPPDQRSIQQTHQPLTDQMSTYQMPPDQRSIQQMYQPMYQQMYQLPTDQMSMNQMLPDQISIQQTHQPMYQQMYQLPTDQMPTDQMLDQRSIQQTHQPMYQQMYQLPADQMPDHRSIQQTHQPMYRQMYQQSTDAMPTDHITTQTMSQMPLQAQIHQTMGQIHVQERTCNEGGLLENVCNERSAVKIGDRKLLDYGLF